MLTCRRYPSKWWFKGTNPEFENPLQNAGSIRFVDLHPPPIGGGGMSGDRPQQPSRVHGNSPRSCRREVGVIFVWPRFPFHLGQKWGTRVNTCLWVPLFFSPQIYYTHIIYIHMYIYIYTHISISVCIYIYIPPLKTRPCCSAREVRSFWRCCQNWSHFTMLRLCH